MTEKKGPAKTGTRFINLLRSTPPKPKTAMAAPPVTGVGAAARGSEVVLEKVLGITAVGNSALTCNSPTGLLAYPAGCVVVLLNPRKNHQGYIFNSSRKAVTTLAFSPDGKYVATGECGHKPAVRVWDVSERLQVKELQGHKFGVACVAFSPNGKYIVSVGYEHDMMVNVWNWKKKQLVAANKVSNKVTAVSFSDDSSYFVTAGNRHVKFWYLDPNKTSKDQSTAPLEGRPARLKNLMNNFFSDVACGRGQHSSSTFCITSSARLCKFTRDRLLDKWVKLQTSQATCLSVTEDFIFCGCSDGTVQVFSPVNLNFLYPFPRPHSLRTDIAQMTDPSQLFSRTAESVCPDTVAMTCDPTNHWLSCVYSDHSVYVWDIRELQRPGKLYSALYHSSSVWNLEVSTGGTGDGERLLPPGSFLSCSSDNTIRLWNMDGHSALHRNILSHDLKNVIYVEDNDSSLHEADSITAAGGNAEKVGPEEGQQTDLIRTGIRVLRVSPDRRHLASGDFKGILRIHDLRATEEIFNIKAHESEILCLEFSTPDTGLQLLATASRDRLIHILDVGRDYSLVQTLQDHSSSINAVRFAANEGKVWMISCGADKNICFYVAQQTREGLEFTRKHCVVSKTTLNDMEVEPNRKCAAVGCKDRSIRIFDISTGKEKTSYKGSQGRNGSIIKVHIDPSGLYIATSCSDKNISIFDFFSGECVATMFGHSEIITGLKFSGDCKHLITVSGDSCIFVWRLSPEMTIRMRQRLADLKPRRSISHRQNAPQQRAVKVSRTPPPCVDMMSSDSNGEEEEEEEQPRPYMETARCVKEAEMFGRDDRKEDSTAQLPRRRWSRRTSSADSVLMVKSMFDLRMLDSASPDIHGEQEEGKTRPHPDYGLKRRTPAVEPKLHRASEDLQSTTSLQVASAWVEEESKTSQRPDFILLSNQSLNREEPVLFPDQWEDRVSLMSSEFQVKEACPTEGGQQEKPSPDSGCSLGFSSALSSPERPAGDDTEPTEPLSEDGNSSELEMEEEEVVGRQRREGAGGSQNVPQTPDQEAFLKENFVTLADPSASGSPSRTSHSSSESLSISSRFLHQSSAASRAGLLLPTQSAEGAGGEVKVQLLVSEVRPLMDKNYSRRNDGKALGNQNQDQPQTQKDQPPLVQVQNPNQQGPDLPQQQQGAPEETSSGHPGFRSATSKKKAQTEVEPRRNMVLPTPSHQNLGLHKAQSVNSLLADAGELSDSLNCRSSREVTPQRPTTLPSSLRRPPSTAPPTLKPNSAPSPRSPLQESAAVTLRKSSSSSAAVAAPRSYMSPTASSMAKISRSVSMGDSLNILEPSDAVTSPQLAPNPPIQSKEAPPTNVAVGNSAALPATPPHAAVIPVVVTSSSSAAGNHGNRAGPPPRILQARVSGSSKPLPDKPSLDVFSPPTKPSASLSPPSLLQSSASLLVPSKLGEEPVSDAGGDSEDAGDKEQPISVETCRALANELQSCFKRATHLYRKVSGFSPEESTSIQCQVSLLLSEAFRAMRAELDSLPLGSQSMLGGAEDVRTAALLEEYSLLLLQAVNRRINSS